MNRGEIILGDKTLGSKSHGAKIHGAKIRGAKIRGAKSGGAKPAIPAGTSVVAKKPSERVGATAPQGDEPKTGWPRFCGAMSQQQGHATAQSTPQKFVHLVGYRDPNTKPVRR